MRTYLLTPVLIFATMYQLHAQKLEVTGSVLDSLSQPLPSATVVLLQAQDSILKHFAMADNRGLFSIKGVTPNEYVLQVSYLGYQPHYQRFSAPDGQSSVDLGRIQLVAQSALLQEVVVKAEHNPVSMRRDTIEYNTAAFKTQPNAVVEDLLKKLPGVEVERDGTIKAQGERVQNVLVDGKEFFGKDPQIATKNLPADAVDKVQVYDKKSDMAEFTGIDDGQEEKTINLALKEDRKKGVFGQLRAGGGTQERFEGKANINRFSPSRQFSVLGLANNVNEAGFSFQDYLNFSGGLQNMMSGGKVRLEIDGDNNAGIPLNMSGGAQGILTTYAGGINFNNEFNDKTELQTSYFFNQADQETDRESRRENFFGDQVFSSSQNNLENSLNRNHRINLTLDHRLDSLQSLKFTGRFGFSDNDLVTSQSSRLFTANDQLNTDGERNYQSSGNGLNYNTSLLYRRRFSKKGRTFSTQLNLNRNDREGDGLLDSYNRFWTNGLIGRVDTILQNNLQNNDRRNYGADMTVTEPIGKKQYLIVDYNYRRDLNEAQREVFDLPVDLIGSPLFNSLLSNHYQSDYTYHRPGILYKLVGKNSNFSAGVDWQQSRLKGDLLIQEVTIDQSFSNLLPNMRWNYDFTSSSNVSVSYRTDLREPSVRELAPIVDNTDPLNIYEGNPDLRPAYDHNLEFHFFSFNAAELKNFMSFIQLRYTHDRIVNAQSIDENFVRTIQPVNVDSDYSLLADLSYSTPLRFIKSRINLSGNTEIGRGINFLNARENKTDRLTLGGNVRIENRFKEVVDISVGVKLSYNQLRYSLDSDFNQDYLNQMYFTDFGLKLPKSLFFKTDLEYNVYNGIGQGFDQALTLWNASLAKTIFKNQRGEIKVSARDILNQNRSITRRPQLNFIEEESVRNIGRYFLLSFTYQLSAAGEGGGGFVIKMEER